MEWIRREIANGLQALLSLRLDNTPAEDMIELTADIWVQAFAQRCRSESVDAPRIRAGFRETFPRIRKWPVPADVLERMPPRPDPPQLPPPEPNEEGRQRIQTMIDELISKLYVKKEKKR